MGLKLKVITPTGVTFNRETDSVVIPSTSGEIEIFPGHLPLITIIKPGELVAKFSDGHHEHYAIDSGFAKVSNDFIFILTDESLNIDADDLAEIAEATERAEEALRLAREERQKLDPEEIEKLDAKVRYQMAERLSKTKK